MNCKLLLEDLEEAPGLHKGKFIRATGECCSFGWLAKCAGMKRWRTNTSFKRIRRRYGIFEQDCWSWDIFRHAVLRANDDFEGSSGERKKHMIAWIKEKYCHD